MLLQLSQVSCSFPCWLLGPRDHREPEISIITLESRDISPPNTVPFMQHLQATGHTQRTTPSLGWLSWFLVVACTHVWAFTAKRIMIKVPAASLLSRIILATRVFRVMCVIGKGTDLSAFISLPAHSLEASSIRTKGKCKQTVSCSLLRVCYSGG